MKLNELDIADLRARAPRHRDAIAGRDIGIRRFLEDSAQSAGREQYRACVHIAQRAAFLVKHHRARGASSLSADPDRRSRSQIEFAEATRLLIECACNLPPGGIAMRVQNAVAAVRAFARERKPLPFAIELRAPVDQLLNRGRAFFHQRADSLAVAESIARIERVLLMQRHLVVVA